MANTGTTWERRVRLHLENAGYFVCRSAGSRGPCDLVAWNVLEGEVLLIQCKKELKKKSYKEDIERLNSLQAFRGWKKQLWVKNGVNVKIYDVYREPVFTKEMMLRDMK